MTFEVATAPSDFDSTGWKPEGVFRTNLIALLNGNENTLRNVSNASVVDAVILTPSTAHRSLALASATTATDSAPMGEIGEVRGQRRRLLSLTVRADIQLVSMTAAQSAMDKIALTDAAAMSAELGMVVTSLTAPTLDVLAFEAPSPPPPSPPPSPPAPPASPPVPPLHPPDLPFAQMWRGDAASPSRRALRERFEQSRRTVAAEAARVPRRRPNATPTPTTTPAPAPTPTSTLTPTPTPTPNPYPYPYPHPYDYDYPYPYPYP